MSTPQDGIAIDDPDDAAVPATGDPSIDEALQGLHDLRSTPLAQHHDRLGRAHEALHIALERSGDEPNPG